MDELKDTWLENAVGSSSNLFSNVWHDVDFIDHEGNPSQISKAYGRIDGTAIATLARSLADKVYLGVKVLNVQEIGITINVVTSDEPLTARFFIDCTGHTSKGFGNTVTTQESATGYIQSFYGEEIQCIKHGIKRARLMDWSMAMPETESGKYPPSFAYVLPLNDNEVFIEETVLLSETRVPFKILRQRLEQRKFSLQLNYGHISRKELYWLPMGGTTRTFQPSTPRNICFGASAGMGHDATGFMFSSLVNHAPILTKCLLENSEFSSCSSSTIVKHFNVLGAFVLKEIKDRRQLSSFLKTTFKTPFWFEFLTQNISALVYVFNMMLFAYHYEYRFSVLLVGIIKYVGYVIRRKIKCRN